MIRTRKVDHARGSTSRPLADSDLERKLKDLVEYGGSKCVAGPLIDAIWSLDAADEAGAVMPLAAGRR